LNNLSHVGVLHLFARGYSETKTELASFPILLVDFA